MALLEDMFKGAGGSGLAVGLGVAILGPVLLPVLARAARPAAKTVVKTGISIYRQATTGLAEAATGLVDEAREELAHEGVASHMVASSGLESSRTTRGKGGHRRH